MHNRLEAYLQEVVAHLRPLPPGRRDEEVRELREHLLTLVAANQELGDTEEEAVEAAIRQFGEPKEVSRDLLRAWRLGRTPFRGTLFGAAACAFASPILVSTVLIMLLNLPTVREATSSEKSLAYMVAFGMPLVSSLTTALVTAIVAPRRAVVGTLMGATLYSALCLFRSHPHLSNENYDGFANVYVLTYVTYFAWTLFTVGSAGAVQWWIRRRARRALG